MAQHVEVHIIIDGKNIAPFSSISISQDIHQHHAFEIVLPADAFKDTGKVILQQSKDFIGKEINIRFGIHLFKKSHSDHEFMGVVTEVGLNRFGNGERNVILRGNSPTILMDGNLQCKSYTEKSLKEIANATLEKIPHTLSTQIEPIFKSKIPYVVQYKESNFDFLQRMAARYGEWCFYDGTQLVFGKLPREKTVDLPFNKDLFNFEFSLKLIPVNFKTLAYNYLENTSYQSIAANASVNDLDEFGQFALDKSNKFYGQEPAFTTVYPITQQNQLDELVTHRRASLAHNMVMNSGTSDNPYINIGNIINITGESTNEQDYGEFIITSLVHNISGTLSYQNSFTAIPAEIQSPPPLHLPNPLGEIQAAVVKDNVDPQGLGRIRVQFPWQDNSEMTPWIRVTAPYAGKGDQGELHGFYFIPEVGTEVLVGYEDDNPDKPFMLGCVYHGKSSPDLWKNDKNHKKVIKTRNGNQIHFSDEDGKEQIRIVNKDDKDATNEICLSLEEDGKITIKTKGKLSLSAKSIDIEAQEGITMTSGKNTDFKANEVTMDAGQGFDLKAQKAKVDAGQNLEMKSQQMKMEATTTSINASAQLEIDGGQSSIKAKMLQIDGGSVATVSAGIIKLN